MICNLSFKNQNITIHNPIPNWLDVNHLFEGPPWGGVHGSALTAILLKMVWNWKKWDDLRKCRIIGCKIRLDSIYHDKKRVLNEFGWNWVPTRVFCNLVWEMHNTNFDLIFARFNFKILSKISKKNWNIHRSCLSYHHCHLVDSNHRPHYPQQDRP